MKTPGPTIKLSAAALGLALTVASATSMSGCSESDSTDNDGLGGQGGDSPGGAYDGSESEPLYAMMIQVYGTDDRTVYVHLSNTLDIDKIDLSRDREFPGVANLAAIDKKLYISSGDAPEISRYSIDDNFNWSTLDPKTDVADFSNYPLEDNANFYYQFILNNETAYLPFDVTKRLLWNPSTMRIGASLEDSNLQLETEDGLLLRAGGNRNSIHFEGPVQQAFFYTDADWFAHGDESLVAIYDAKTHEEEKIITLPCPGLSIATQDEDGYTYYGPWGFPGLLTLFGDAPTPCVARLKPDLSLDTEWTTDLQDITGGRQFNNFRYVGNGKAIANVLHDELLDIDFAAGYNPDAADEISASGEHWKFWLIDLEAGEGAPVEGIDIPTSSGAQFAVLDGRTFVFLPYDDWGRSKIYEIDDEGVATEHGDTTGDIFKWIRIR